MVLKNLLSVEIVNNRAGIFSICFMNTNPEGPYLGCMSSSYCNNMLVFNSATMEWEPWESQVECEIERVD
jgi:hypothetical protein